MMKWIDLNSDKKAKKCQANWDSVPKMKLFKDSSGSMLSGELTLSVNGVDDCEWLEKMAGEIGGEVDPVSGTLALKNNPDCEFVKGGPDE